jgi:hypothetical protein
MHSRTEPIPKASESSAIPPPVEDVTPPLAKTDTAMKYEVLAKIVCHNLCCCISAWYELGIDPSDWLPKGALQVTDPENYEPCDVLRFPAG